MGLFAQGHPVSLALRVPTQRAALVRAGIRVEQVTLAWMLMESAVAIGAGVVARSVALTAFGLDSVVELVSGGVLLWRLVTEAQGSPLQRVERAERRAAWVTGVALVLLCGYVPVTAAVSLLTHTQAESSRIGIGLALVAVVSMPVLARRKRAIAVPLGSAALRGDAACSITCAYMAATLLAGLMLTALLGWWWADSLAALGLLYWLVPEAREAIEGARAGHGTCACDDDGCTD